MSDELDELAGEDGVHRGTGLLLPEPGFVSSFPVFESVQPMLDWDEIERIAKSGEADKRSTFTEDWIQYQRDKSSCNGYATAAALSRTRYRRGLGKMLLSGAYIYSLINGGRDRGSMLEDGMRAVQERGIATEATVPWDRIYTNSYPAAANSEAERFKGFECYAVRSKQALYSALALGFDCVVAVHADASFDRIDGKGIAGPGRGPGNHAVMADGLRWEGEVVENGVNSWSTRWGDRGRMGMTWERHHATTNAYHVLYAIRSASDDPQGDNPPAVRNAA